MQADRLTQALTLIDNAYLWLALAILLAWCAGWIVHLLGRAVVLRLSRPLPMLDAVLRRIEGATRQALPLLFVQIVIRAAPDDLRGIEPMRHLASVLLILSIIWLLINAVRGMGEAITARHPVNVVDNLEARRIHTQTHVLVRATCVVIVVLGVAAILMSFPAVRTIGASLLASAGVAGLAIGMAARPVLGNLIAGVQIALTQPIRIDDVLIIEGEWGRVEEITGSYVVLRIWDRRRLVIPLEWFIANPFQNWTRNSADIIGTVFWWVDYRLPVAPVEAEIRRLCAEVPQWWDGELAMLQVTDTSPQGMQLRALVTARNSGDAWDLRCHVRAGVVDFIQREYPECLPRVRAELEAPPAPPASPPGRAPAEAPSP
ncbi:MAG: mechanosensitive ion channel [Candidatus Dactylopiibacterium sp.]|nr:mechanosensitive ion channel [Candidatus Dactylopiibacterium sp.]